MTAKELVTKLLECHPDSPVCDDSGNVVVGVHAQSAGRIMTQIRDTMSRFFGYSLEPIPADPQPGEGIKTAWLKTLAREDVVVLSVGLPPESPRTK